MITKYVFRIKLRSRLMTNKTFFLNLFTKNIEKENKHKIQLFNNTDGLQLISFVKCYLQVDTFFFSDRASVIACHHFTKETKFLKFI